MAIPGSGAVSIGTIRTELQNTGKNNFSLRFAGRPSATFNPDYTPINQNSSSKPNDSSPYSISEWRNYDHSAFGNCSGTSFTTPDISTFYTYYKIRLTGASSYTTSISVVCNSAPNANSTVYTLFYTSYPFTNVGQLTGTAVLTFTQTSAGTSTQTYTMTSSQVDFHVVCYVIQN
jgi:hypothetical protein